MSHFDIVIDEKKIGVKEGDLLIDVLLDNNIEIAHFCYHKALGADGNCRMCMVEIQGQKRPQIACDTLVKEGMIVSTTSKNITEVRRSILELELLNHPVDCPICDQAGECKLQDYYMDFGLYDSNVSVSKNHKKKHVDLGSNVMLDQERCVLCARCTRFTQKITKTHELFIANRGDSACVTTLPNNRLNNPYAMNVIDLCPVGALTSKDFRFKQRVWFLESTKSICHGCAKGCNITIDFNQPKYQSEKIYRFRPRHNDAINGYFICDEGRLSYKALNEASLHVSSDVTKSKKALQEAREIAIIMDASLSLEQMQRVMAFAKRYNATLFAPPIIEPQFADDFLRQAIRSANFEGVKSLHISYDEPTCKQSLAQAELIVNINHPYFNDENTPYSREFHNKSVIHIATHISDYHTRGGYFHSFAPFCYEEGTLISSDGIKQRYHRGLHVDETMMRLETLLSELGGVHA